MQPVSLQRTSYAPSLCHRHFIAYSQRSPQYYILIKGFRNNNGDNKDSPPSLSSAFCRQTTLGGIWEEIGEEEEGMEER